jgi:hypothetical protein
LLSWRSVRTRLRVGLGLRVVGLAILAVLVTGGLIGSLVITSSRDTLRADILSRNLGTADLAGNLATSFVEGAETSVRQLALRPLFIAAVLQQDLEQAEWHMEQVMQTDTRFDNIAVYTADGIGWASGLKSKWQNRGGSVVDREWFQLTLDTRAPRCLLHRTDVRRPGRNVRDAGRRRFARRACRHDRRRADQQVSAGESRRLARGRHCCGRHRPGAHPATCRSTE